MGWGKEWPNVEIIPPSEPQNEFWSNGGITHSHMTKEDFKKLYEQDWSGIDLGSPEGDKTVAVLGNVENGVLKIDKCLEGEEAKVYIDALAHGQGWSQDGKQVPLDKIYNYCLTDPVPLDGDKLATKRPFNNLRPTHDPYTNPDAHIYYECGCGEILDPKTKSFAALNNYASEQGWKIRFTDKGYVPYCVDCGENVE